MIKDNLKIVIKQLNYMRGKSSNVIGYLQKFKEAEEITDLTQEQVDGILTEINTYAQDISTIYTSLVKSFQATEKIEEIEEVPEE